ncbi:ribosome silencing factor [Parasedimentitalea marina]|uniref:Ribosomal silencing factor RsfS n=1 Tax=Parasedimentitalea marina TaxID=2483033 RepID=A0A3T0MXQ3_9RHOB|nr:ribosome silencing factor [Parasedimentitalea marina]AZV76530.1 ribosome silencing factor [Parasedimentitalea marina]
MPSAGGRTAPKKEDNVLSPDSEAANAADRGAAVTAAQTRPSSDELLAFILSSLDEDKAEDVVQIDLRGKTAIGDHMVVATGRSTRQVTALATKLAERIKQDFGFVCKTEGRDTGDWVLVDTGDVIVHVFRPEVREFYQIEKMWLGGDSAV